MPEAVTDGQRNVSGAIFFFLYIIAALVFTGLIVSDLYKARLSSSQRAPRNGTSALRLRTTILLACLSFASLSYHMLDFLVVSYSSWLHNNLNSSGTGPWRIEQIWQWASHSTLFQNFTEAILDSPQGYFWTRKTLVYSFFVELLDGGEW